MNESIFRQYDIRGRVGRDFQIKDICQIGYAIAYYFYQKNPLVRSIAVGMDGRFHSPDIKEELCRVFTESGLDVIFIGVCPTPVLYYTLFTQPVDGGVMITASHNGPEYNGLKLCLNKKAVALEEIAAIKDIYLANKVHTPSQHGVYKEQGMNEQYIEFLYTEFQHLRDIKLNIVLDCGGGASAKIIPPLVERMGWKKVEILYGEIDGHFLHHSPDPTNEDNIAELKKLVMQKNVDVGAAFDGDADRMVSVTNTGSVVSGDRLLLVFAQYIYEHFKKPFSVVFDAKSSQKLPEQLLSWGLKPVMAPTGHAYIKKAMDECDGLLAGEISCHFFFADRYFGFDDGIYAFMRIVEILAASKKRFDELISIFPQTFATPEIRISCEDRQKEIIDEIRTSYAHRPEITVSTLDGVRIVFEDGWFLVRSSNTEPVISLRLEADTQIAFQTYKEDLIHILKKYLDEHYLEKKLRI